MVSQPKNQITNTLNMSNQEENRNNNSQPNDSQSGKRPSGPSNPFTGRPIKLNGKKPTGSRVMYIIYTSVLILLCLLWFGKGSSSPEKITWERLETILQNQDEEKIVVVNQEFAEIYIKKDALKSDTTYKDLYGKSAFGKDLPDAGFYRYEVVTFESFENDIRRVEDQIITRDTTGMSDSTGAISNAKLTEIQRNAHIDLTPEKRANAWRDLLVVFGPFLLLIIFFIVMSRMSARQMGGGGGGGIFNVGKSKAKLYDGKTLVNITFKDVACLAGAKEEVMEVVDFLKNPHRYTDLGGKILKGVLLVGTTGTGKTLLAKAVAGEANVPFFSMSCSDFVEMFVGVDASRVRDLFEEAKKKSPCIVFIDEIDAVGRQRGAGLGGGHDEREQTLNQLLVEM